MASTSNFNVSPKDIFKIPHVDRKDNRNKNDKRKGKSVILTSSPYKQELEEAEKAKKGKAVKNLKLGSPNINNRVLVKTIRAKCAKNPRQEKIQTTDSSESEEEEEDEACIYCNDLYSNSKSCEGWIKCLQCQGWAHEACSGLDSEDCDSFVCEFCSLV